MVKRVLHSLHIHKVAVVDRPCQEEALAVLVKRRAAASIQSLEELEPMVAKTKQEIAEVITDIAKRECPEGLTDAQAVARFIKSDPRGRMLYEAHGRAPEGERKVVDMPVRKAVPAPTSGHLRLCEKAEEIRKSKPDLSFAQAYTRALKDPANRDVVKQHHSEMHKRWFGDPQDAA